MDKLSFHRLGGVGAAVVLTVSVVPAAWAAQDRMRVPSVAALCMVPAPPEDLELHANADVSITVSWSASAGATSYNIYRGIKKGGEGKTPIASTSRTTYHDRHLSTKPVYFYEVTAVTS